MRRNHTMKALVAAALAVFALGLVACGGEESETNGSAESGSADVPASGFENGTLTVVADPDGALAYTETDLTAEAGTVTVDFENPSPTGHDVVIETEDGDEVGASDIITSDSDSFEADLEPGTYTYFCSVPGHREAGMEGTLTVE